VWGGEHVVCVCVWVSECVVVGVGWGGEGVVCVWGGVRGGGGGWGGGGGGVGAGGGGGGRGGGGGGEGGRGGGGGGGVAWGWDSTRVGQHGDRREWSSMGVRQHWG